MTNKTSTDPVVVSDLRHRGDLYSKLFSVQYQQLCPGRLVRIVPSNVFEEILWTLLELFGQPWPTEYVSEVFNCEPHDSDKYSTHTQASRPFGVPDPVVSPWWTKSARLK